MKLFLRIILMLFPLFTLSPYPLSAQDKTGEENSWAYSATSPFLHTLDIPAHSVQPLSEPDAVPEFLPIAVMQHQQQIQAHPFQTGNSKNHIHPHLFASIKMHPTMGEITAITALSPYVIGALSPLSKENGHYIIGPLPHTEHADRYCSFLMQHASHLISQCQAEQHFLKHPEKYRLSAASFLAPQNIEKTITRLEGESLQPDKMMLIKVLSNGVYISDNNDFIFFTPVTDTGDLR